MGYANLNHTVPKNFLLSIEDETRVLKKLLSDLSSASVLFQPDDFLVWTYFCPNRERLFRARHRKGTFVKSSRIISLRSVHFGVFQSREILYDKEGKEVGELSTLKSQRYINRFFLPNKDYVDFGQYLVLYFGEPLF